MGDDGLTPKDQPRYRRLKHEAETRLLQSVDVICVCANDPR